MPSAENHARARSTLRPRSLDADRYVTQRETSVLYRSVDSLISTTRWATNIDLPHSTVETRSRGEHNLFLLTIKASSPPDLVQK